MIIPSLINPITLVSNVFMKNNDFLKKIEQHCFTVLQIVFNAFISRRWQNSCIYFCIHSVTISLVVWPQDSSSVNLRDNESKESNDILI